MSVYDLNENILTSVYANDGNEIDTAYDMDGNVVFSKRPIESDIRIMSYNVQKWKYINEIKEIQDVAFGYYDADIIGIQEWGNGGTIGDKSAQNYIADFGYPNIYITTLDVNHKGIASKIGMTDMTEVVYSQNIERRSYTKSYFTCKGKQIAFFNTHTDYQYNNSIKYAQVQELLQAVSNEEYFILTADLNTTCSTKQEIEYTTIVFPFIQAGYNVANSPNNTNLIWTFYSGKTAETSGQITPPDNIITSSNIDIIDVFVDTTKLTNNPTDYGIDHIPLIADIAIN